MPTESAALGFARLHRACDRNISAQGYSCAVRSQSPYAPLIVFPWRRLPPDALDLSEFCASGLTAAEQLQRPVYDLVAVVNHTGSIDEGHYTAEVRAVPTPAERSKGLLSARWYRCSDECVEPAGSPGSEASSQAYLLMYVRRAFAEHMAEQKTVAWHRRVI